MKTGMKKIMYIEENEAHRELMPDVLEAAMPKLIVLPHTYNSAKSAKLKYHLIIANITRNNGEKQLNELAKVLERQTTAPLIITVERNKVKIRSSSNSRKEPGKFRPESCQVGPLENATERCRRKNKTGL